MEVGMTYYTCVKEVPFLHTQVTQVFIDTLAAQRPNNLIKQEKGLKHVNNTINLRNEEKVKPTSCYRMEPGNDLRRN